MARSATLVSIIDDVLVMLASMLRLQSDTEAPESRQGD
jgi:hypothetical protein